MGGVLGLLDALPDGSPDVGDIHSGGGATSWRSESISLARK